MAKIIGNTTATPNPRPDWNQTDETKADYIKNKPTILTEEDVMELIGENGGISGGDSVVIDQIQSDWNQTDETQVDYIKNKPTLVDKFSEDENGNLLYDGNAIGKDTVFVELTGSGGNVTLSTSYEEIDELINNQQPVVLFRKKSDKQIDYYHYTGWFYSSASLQYHRFTYNNEATQTQISVCSSGTIRQTTNTLVTDDALESYYLKSETEQYVNDAINGTLGELERIIDESGVLE